MAGAAAPGGDSGPSPRWVDLRQLAECAPIDGLDADGTIVEPVWLLRLDGPVDEAVADAAAQAAPDAGRILIGVATGALDPALDPLVSALDLTLVPPGAETSRDRVAVPHPVTAAAELCRSVVANQQAATVLAGLLRWSGSLRVPG